MTTTKSISSPLTARSGSPITISSPTKQATDSPVTVHKKPAQRPLNQPIYAKHRIITSPAKKPVAERENSELRKEDKSENDNKTSQLNDSNISKNETNKPQNENAKKEDQDNTKSKKAPHDFDEFSLPKSNNNAREKLYMSSQRYHNMSMKNRNYTSDYRYTSQALARDPSAMATISESELAFLTRPSNNTGNCY